MRITPAAALLHTFLGPTVVRVPRPQFEDFPLPTGRVERRWRTKTTLHAQHGKRERERRIRQIAAGQLRVG